MQEWKGFVDEEVVKLRKAVSQLRFQNAGHVASPMERLEAEIANFA
jgi:hypothetical protein